MKKPKIFVHGSYIGDTGYNQHTRDFFRELSKYSDIKVRNFTIGRSWTNLSNEPHNNEHYFNEVDKKLLYEQVLWNNDKTRGNFKIYESKDKEFTPDLNIVLCETDHYLFYDSYTGPKIAYNVWESTLQPQGFFDKLKEFDELWVPSKWQKECSIKQGYDANKIKVVPEGVDVSTFYPDPTASHPLTSNDRFTFFLAGRWDYRKSTKEIIETFLKTFSKNEPVDLIVSIDNPFSGDGFNSTEERLEHYGLMDERIKIIHFPPREEYIQLIKSCNCYLSCARSEGWNLPLIEAMACGIPSIYSSCSGQLEFAEGKGIPVNVVGLRPATDSSYNHYNETVGEYYEPDFEHLSEKMRFTYEFYDQIKPTSLLESKEIREEYSWNNVAKIGLETINDFLDRKPWLNKPKQKNKTFVSFLDGPRVEILGDESKHYFIEFINKKTSEVLHSAIITNNMWTACGIKYYIPWQIRIDGEIYEELDLEGQEVLISMESKSLGDTIGWAPYVVKFAEEHNCKVIFSSFHNSFFENIPEYKNIKFIVPGSSHSCKALYRLGWFRDDSGGWDSPNNNPNQVNTIPLQQTATDILGLKYEELNYGIDFPKGKRPQEKEYIVFAPNATAGCKEWIYEHWVVLSNMIKELGYDVILLTQNPYYIDGVQNVWGEPLSVVANYLHHAKAFIGLGSGLSWFNWALGKHTFMINGFARPGHEFTTNITRIYNDNVCIFCWNDEVFSFDGGDWDWCPVYKGTKKQHICQKSITPSQVFLKLDL